MIEALESDYVEMARLKGVPKWRIVLIHALPNAMAPVIQVIGLNFLYLAGGVVVVEYVFAFPGIGQGLVYAVENRDIPVIQFIVVLLAAFYVVHEHRDRRDRAAGHAAAPDPQVGRRAGTDRPLPRARRGADPPPPVAGRPWAGGAHPARRRRAGAGRRSSCRSRSSARFMASDSPTALLTFPFAKPSGQFLLGGDFLGRDVLSRVLDGGWLLLLMAVAATVARDRRRGGRRDQRRLPPRPLRRADHAHRRRDPGLPAAGLRPAAAEHPGPEAVADRAGRRADSTRPRWPGCCGPRPWTSPSGISSRWPSCRGCARPR